ncbi:MAG: NifU family protein [Nitrospinae bacterium]|nr:NifU family protein [Nitrospinota bacterium]
MSVVEEKYSAKFESAVSQPKNRGAYYPEDAVEKGMALLQAKFKDLKLYWLVDTAEDRIYSAKFFAYGGKVSLAIGETLSTMVKGLTVQEAFSLLGPDVERLLRDDLQVPAVPESKLSAFSAVEELLRLMEKEYPSAKALALASSAMKEKETGPGNAPERVGQARIALDNAYSPSESSLSAPAPRRPGTLSELSMAEQAWLALSPEEQIGMLDLVLDEKIRPALNNDGGNVLVKEVIDGRKVIIHYQGACGSCGSSIGGTLAFIEQTLRRNIYNDLVVVPDTYADLM